MKTKLSLIVTGALITPLVLSGCGSNDTAPNTETTPILSSASFTIQAIGGLGGENNGYGGDGGSVDLDKESGPGDLDLLSNGSADASFTTTSVNANLGNNPLAITTDTTIEVVTEEPAAGTPYLTASNQNLHISDGNGTLADEVRVSGISVASGTTLTLGMNYTTYALLSLNLDLANSGTITTTDANALNRGDLRIHLGSYIGTADSSINTAATQDSQNGGYIDINTDFSFFNHGTLITSGGNSAAGAGGHGGRVEIDVDYNLENTGAITTNGGGATEGTAGQAGEIELVSDDGYMHNSGSLSARGGNGLTGGDGSSIYLKSEDGNLLNSGNINGSGGNGSGGNGGAADYAEMNTEGHKLINSGNITMRGGNTADPLSHGGSGGDIYFYSEEGYLYEGTPVKDMLISGNLDTSGGNAVATGSGNGGSAGEIDAEIEADDMPSDARIAFLGYNSINTSGGNGNHGGSGSTLSLYNNSFYSSDLDQDIPGGNVTNEVNLTARGGDAVTTATTTPAYGGDGGSLSLETDYETSYLDASIGKTTNSGDADLSGGNNLEGTRDSNNESGSVWFWGYNGTSNSGNLTANGGNDLSTTGGITGYGGSSDHIEMYAELGPINNSGDLSANGGNGEYRGGGAGGIDLFGPTINNSGNLTGKGGNTNATLTESRGGDGAWIEIFSPQGPHGINNSGSINHAGGTGETASYDGSFVSGGVCVSGSCNDENIKY